MVLSVSFLTRNLWASSFQPYFDLSLLGDFYTTPSESDLNNVQLQGRFKLLSQKETSKVYFDLGAGGLVGKRAENYFMLPQAYVSLQKGEQFEFTVGRIIKNYSELDTYWQMGDVMPLFRWDAARPEMQGLAGAFATYKPTRNIHLDFFTSFLFLPTQGPSFSIVGGKLLSGNPWFYPPADILELSGTPFDLNYSVNTPDISEIVLQPSVGASLFAQTSDEFLWIRAGYFLKQRNELVTPFEGLVLLPPANTADIEVHPQVAHHKITTLDVGLKAESWAFTFSGLYESDVKFKTESNWIYPQYTDQYKVSMNALLQMTAFHSIEMGALKTFDNQVTVRGLAGASNLDIFSFRNQYDNTVDLRWTSVFFPVDQGFLFKTKARVAYDYKAETTLISFEGIYSPVLDLNLFARADLFGGERLTTEAYNNLLVNYLNKDRFQIGAKYVF
ncbi:hypothetical protein K2X05_00765 [bacterium]|nr:hypothetical protein [bacterium]